MLTPVRLTDDNRLLIIDQSLLPQQLVELELRDKQSLIEAIRSLRVRGAPAIGVAAALGVYVIARQQTAEDRPALLADVAEIAAARPTAVNLMWATARMRQVIEQADNLLPALRAEALAIQAEDEQLCRRIGEHAYALLRPGIRLLTHCNAGALATCGIGTALAPIYLALERGLPFTVYCDETRPLLQGARLTAWELEQAGAQPILLCDNMAASLMAAGEVDAVFVGADRIACNGDTANKIGTLSLAINAKHFGIPFYVCAPSSSFDPLAASAADIPIEQRPAAEVRESWFAQPMAPAGVRVYNPAFDITPGQLISAIIDEHGVHSQPYNFVNKTV